MRTFQIALIFVLIGIVGYAYVKNPTGCMTILDDFGALFNSLSPVKVEINNGGATISTGNSTNAAPEAASTTTAPAVSAPAVPTPAAAPVSLPLPANSLIQNGDFSYGNAHWEGDGITPRMYAARSLVAPTDPLTSKGLIVTLNPTSWTRIYQTFPTDKGTVYSIIVNYRLSPDITLSKDPADYKDISKQMAVPGFEIFTGNTFPPGVFYGTVGDPSSNKIALEVYTPKLGTSDVQTYTHTYPSVPVSDSKTFALAFPPGTGIVVILSTAVTSN